ncbi:MAG: hypothetical protein KME21_31085 [Desmonostoc vinosum HA7617-LM4]|jgi:hypothetical protein|nr:hypothetical protein [Desmonostoc vinosum HA7617-LM4]
MDVQRLAKKDWKIKARTPKNIKTVTIKYVRHPSWKKYKEEFNVGYRLVNDSDHRFNSLFNWAPIQISLEGKTVKWFLPDDIERVLTMFECENCLPIESVVRCLTEVWKQMVKCARIKGLTENKTNLQLKGNCRIFWTRIPATDEKPLKLLFGLTEKRIDQLADNDNIYLWEIQYGTR